MPYRQRGYVKNDADSNTPAMIPTLKQLRYLVSLDETRNFSRAAERCFVTQSTLSGGIQDLETALGVVLFERTKRRVKPTPVGSELITRARRILSEVKGFVDTAQGFGDPLSGPVRLGVIPTIAPFLLPRIMTRIQEAFPRIKLILREEQSARLMSQLGNGDIDVLILAFPYPVPQAEHRLFLRDPFYLVCPPDHPLAALREIPVEDVPTDELLLLEDGHCLRDHALAACRFSGARHANEVQGTSLYTLLHMVAGGLGITLMPAMAVEEGLPQGLGLAAVPMTTDAPPRDIGLVWHQSSGRKEAFTRLAEMLGEIAAKPTSLTIPAKKYAGTQSALARPPSSR